jgi:hypothetical protein
LVLGGDIDWTPAEWDAHMRRLREDAPTKDWPAILAADFVRWLQAERAKCCRRPKIDPLVRVVPIEI